MEGCRMGDGGRMYWGEIGGLTQGNPSDMAVAL